MKKIALIISCVVSCLAILTTVAFAAYVNGYYRKNGTYVQPYYRTNPDSNPYNNYSYPGNYNPNTNRITPGNPNTYLRNYNYTTPSYRYTYPTYTPSYYYTAPSYYTYPSYTPSYYTFP